jgi:hypothetical protein
MTFYKIVDKNGYELPLHYSDRHRTYEEASKLIQRLNQHGEYKPYKMIKIK